MRHIWSLIAGIVAAPVILFLLSIDLQYAQVRLFGNGFLLIFAQLIVIGLLVGALAALRISPAGSVAAGVLTLIPTIIALVSPSAYYTLFSPLQFQMDVVRFDALGGASSGGGIALAGVMLMAGASRGRWRTPDRPAPAQPVMQPMPAAEPVAAADGFSVEDLGPQWSPPVR